MFQCNGGKLEEFEGYNAFSSFLVCQNRNRSALVRELLSLNNGLSISYKEIYHSRFALVMSFTLQLD